MLVLAQARFQALFSYFHVSAFQCGHRLDLRKHGGPTISAARITAVASGCLSRRPRRQAPDGASRPVVVKVKYPQSSGPEETPTVTPGLPSFIPGWNRQSHAMSIASRSHFGSDDFSA